MISKTVTTTSEVILPENSPGNLQADPAGIPRQAASGTPNLIHRLFEAQVERTPDSIAIIHANEHLTYRQLNQKANQLARHLTTMGVGPETLVGICTERSNSMIIGLLAILKAGGAYVPLDHNYPKERLFFILEDTGATLILAQRNTFSKFADRPLKPVLIDNPIPEYSSENIPGGAAEENLSYIVYTSGSTGRPKGVAIEHRNAASLLYWARDAYSPEELSSVLASTSLCFDVSVFEIFATLSWGGKVVIAQNILELPEVATNQEITLLSSVPSAMIELLRANTIPPCVRTVNLAGELVQPVLIEQLYRIPTIQKVYDLYGPSEDTTFSTFGLRRPGGPPTIGRPLPNKQVYILDPNRQPVPLGVMGELYVSGAGVARGYLNRPELTAERFIPDPFSSIAGQRMYRTGDLGKHYPDGNIEFLGRLDDQVKIRGFRVELGEIESVLSRHPAVSEVVVVAREEAQQKQLVAYFVSKPDSPLTPTQLREHSRTLLPDYMVPSLFVLLPALPRTLTGKVDRNALPSAHENRSLDNASSEPKTDMEKALVQIWKDVLCVPQVGIHENFFDLGGHSLLAMQVVSRIRLSLHHEIPLPLFFQHPTISELAAILDSSESKGLDSIKPALQEGDLPLSFSQQRFVLLDEFEPSGIAYLIRHEIRLIGPLNVPALELCLNEIVRRHEILRTVYPKTPLGPRQKTIPDMTLVLPRVSLSHLPVSQREQKAQELVAKECRTRINLQEGPILRFKLLRLSDHDHRLILNIHHIASDGWSCSLFLNELSVLYGAFAKGEPSQLSNPQLQYADYAVWQREWLQGAKRNQLLTYWRKQLNDIPLLSSLPTDHPRPQRQSYRGSSEPISLPASLISSLKQLCQKENCTLFMGLLAAFQAVTSRYSGQTDLVVGSPVANRNRTETESMLGCFMNVLALRTDVSGNPTFRQLLARVREVTLGAYGHQDLPFEELLQDLRPSRDQSHSAIFQIMFVLQNTPAPAVSAGNLRMQTTYLQNGTSKFDLTLDLTDTPDGLTGVAEYASDLFEPSTIRRLLQHWQQLLTAVVSNPEERIAQVSLLNSVDRKQILIDWNNTHRDYPRSECVHQCFEAQAAATPEAWAVECDGEALRYRELNQKANQLAHLLRSMNVGPGIQVGVCLPRSLELVVTILGILKAGGAYVPLDPGYPCERLAQMMQDSKSPVVITDLDTCARKKLSMPGVKDICLDRDREWISEQSRENPAASAGPNDLIYIIYTSGSTGRPKGAAVYHRGFANLLHWFLREFEINRTDHVLLVSSQGFDLTQKNIFAPLMRGGLLHLLPPGLYDPAQLIQHIDQRQITLLNCTPSAFYPLIESADRDAFRKLQSLRCVFLGGEPIAKSRVRPWLDNPHCHGELVNTYGPTECADISAFHRVTRDNIDQLDFIPTGRPIDNVSLVITDAHLGPCTIGVPGELCIAGEGVGAGYLNDPELTSLRFVENPFPEIPGARLYKTGDLARYLPDGKIEFLGRMDHQVKIRGFRIELSEINNALQHHPQVRDVAVLDVENPSHEKRLVAYIVPRQEPEPKAGDLRDFLCEKLPDYMIPSQFVILDALPLSSNGKVDRKALPTPEDQVSQNYVEPQTEMEKAIAQIWCEVLGLPQVGIEDNFFDLGGQSLLATQVIARLQNLINNETIGIADLFECPTISGLCKLAQKATEAPVKATPQLVPLSRKR